MLSSDNSSFPSARTLCRCARIISSSHPPTASRTNGRGVLAMCQRVDPTQRAECQGGLVAAESLQVLHTDFPSSLREKKKSAHLQRQHTQVVIVFIPFPFGAKASIPQARTAVMRLRGDTTRGT